MTYQRPCPNFNKKQLEVVHLNRNVKITAGEIDALLL
jgi:hypothetical protein